MNDKPPPLKVWYSSRQLMHRGEISTWYFEIMTIINHFSQDGGSKHRRGLRELLMKLQRGMKQDNQKKFEESKIRWRQLMLLKMCDIFLMEEQGCQFS